jgi:hypothetical protein
MNYRRIARDDPGAFGGAIVAALGAGDLFLWDSRTIHGSTSGPVQVQAPGDGSIPNSNLGNSSSSSSRSDSTDPPELLRLAAFVCMAPKSKPSVTPRLLELRKEAVTRGWSSGHQACHSNELHENHTRQLGDPQFSPCKPAVLNSKQMGLVA